MSFSVLSDLNWLAVIVATIAYYVLGAAWFADLTFGKAWRRSIGWEPSEGQRPSAGMFVGPLIMCLVATVVVGMLAKATGSNTFSEGIVLGLVVGVGLAGAILFGTSAVEPGRPQPTKWFAITGGYHLVGLLIASVIVSVWP